MLNGFLADTVDMTFASCTTAAVLSELHDLLASLDRHAQLTRCFSAVAELLVKINKKASHTIGYVPAVNRCQSQSQARRVLTLSGWRLSRV